MCVCVIFISYFKHEALALSPNSQMDLIESNISKLKFFVWFVLVSASCVNSKN